MHSACDNVNQHSCEEDSSSRAFNAFWNLRQRRVQHYTAPLDISIKAFLCSLSSHKEKRTSRFTEVHVPPTVAQISYAGASPPASPARPSSHEDLPMIRGAAYDSSHLLPSQTHNLPLEGKHDKFQRLRLSTRIE